MAGCRGFVLGPMRKTTREAGLESGGTVVGREGSGEVRVFKVVSRDGDRESGATTDRRRDARGR